MNYIVYKTTNLCNGRFYVGVHGTSNPDVFDGYLGTNRLLKAAVKKYGKENFKRETLVDCFEDFEEAYSIEAMLVKTKDEDLRSYNLVPGGFGNSKLGSMVVAAKIGIHSATFEERSAWSKETQANIDPAKRLEMCSSGGKKAAELCKTGFQTASPEQRRLNAAKSNETKIRNNSHFAFKDPIAHAEISRKGGILGGKATLGFRRYVDGDKNKTFIAVDRSSKESIESEFSAFLSANPQFRRGRLPQVNRNIK